MWYLYVKHTHYKHIILAFQNQDNLQKQVYVLLLQKHWCSTTIWLIQLPIVCVLPHTTQENLFALVLCCPSSCSNSNSLMLMVCLCLGSCWDHQPTSCGHSLALGRGVPRTGETGEGERERESGRKVGRGFWFDAWGIYPQTDCPPRAERTCG